MRNGSREGRARKSAVGVGDDDGDAGEDAGADAGADTGADGEEAVDDGEDGKAKSLGSHFYFILFSPTFRFCVAVADMPFFGTGKCKKLETFIIA